MRTGKTLRFLNIDHLGLVAGIIDEIGLVEQINKLLGLPHQEKVSAPNPSRANASKFYAWDRCRMLVKK